jgi:vacuolar-type H+-ATPase subunit F/Vma7
MSLRVGVVADAAVALGFRLTGLRPTVADSRESAHAALTEMMSEPGWGMILVQEDLMPDRDASTFPRTDESLPIVVPFPPPSLARAPGDAEAYVAELLRRAVGYRVRLR